jgi:hypothetical protein
MSISVGIGPQVGWFPLGPGEAYVPHYRVSARYVEQINESHFGHRRSGETQNYIAPSQYRFATQGITLLPQKEFNAGSRNVIIHERVLPARESITVREQLPPRDQIQRVPVEIERRPNDGQRWLRGAERNEPVQNNSRQPVQIMPVPTGPNLNQAPAQNFPVMPVQSGPSLNQTPTQNLQQTPAIPMMRRPDAVRNEERQTDAGARAAVRTTPPPAQKESDKQDPRRDRRKEGERER